LTLQLLHLEGFEPSAKLPVKSTFCGSSDAESGALAIQTNATDHDLVSLIDAWSALPDTIRTAILTLVRAAER
jgi:hypothetical protein